MSNYCSECGARLAGGHFCPECGKAVDAGAPSDQTHSRRRLLLRHPAGVTATVAAVLVVVGIGAFAVHARVRNNEQEAATLAAQQEAQEERERAEAEQNRRKKARAKAHARRRAEPSPDVYVVPAPPTPYNGPIDGEWSGGMANGKYTFWLTVTEYGGYVTGEMYQQNTQTGEDGIEVVEGSSEGGVLYLHGVRWRNAPSDWSLDQLALTFSADGGSFTGTYTCDACAPDNPISGRRA